MAQDNYPEQEAGSRKQEAGEQTAEARPDFEIKKQETEHKEEKTEKPDIPDVQKPQIPQEENIPTGGPGDQGQAQPSTTQPQTQEEKAEKIKKELKRPIQINTPQERKESSEIEDGHNKDVLSQP